MRQHSQIEARTNIEEVTLLAGPAIAVLAVTPLYGEAAEGACNYDDTQI
jgi:hypothetical protein